MKESFNKIFGLADKASTDEVKHLPLNEIVPSPFQPRTVFDNERIDELCQTIKTHGVIQPIVVRVRNSKFEIIAGERRYRAVKKLEMDTIPAIIREYNDSQTASIALIENLQREGLTSIEEANAYQQLIDLHGLTQESLAQRLGKSQSTIANKIRLLQLNEEVKQALLARSITERHARALIGLDMEHQQKILLEIVQKGLNVKQTEARVHLYKEKDLLNKQRKRRVSFSKDIRLAVNTIRQSIDMISSSGMDIQTNEKEHADHFEITIKIPKNPIPSSNHK